MDQDETWHGGRLVGLGHTVLDGDPAPPLKGGTAPQFSAHICCGQMAGWINMPLGREVGLDPNNIMLDGDPVPHKRGTAPPPTLFGPWPNDWMDQDASWYGGRPRPRPQTVVSVLSVCLSVCLSVTLAYCGQTVGWIKMKLGMVVDW